MSNIILFTYTIEVNGKYFLRHEQYAYTSTLMKQVDCITCGGNNKYKMMKHYVIEHEEVTYEVPEDAVVEYAETYPPEYVDKANMIYKEFSDNIVDYKKEIKRLLGIDTTLKVDYSAAYLKWIENEKKFFASTNARPFNNSQIIKEKPGNK